jgi:hypothetical protein
MIKLMVEPQLPPMQWDEFVAKAGPYAIALDGFVYGGPQFNERRVALNINHHEEVDRLATRATCAQTLMVIRQGLFELFRTNEGPKANVYVNDCDEDVCLSWFLLKNHHWSEQTMNPLLNRLVAMEDALDATAGAYPFPVDLPVLQELAWIFEPYRQFRLSGEIDKKQPHAYRSIIEDVANRIGHHLVGNGDRRHLDTRFEVIGGGKGWKMVKETGAQARTGMFAEGIRAYVSVRERPDGKYTYVLGRMSPFIPFNLQALFKRFNAEEGKDALDCWGGSNTVGGSPRVGGSKLTPEELTRVINDVLFPEKRIMSVAEMNAVMDDDKFCVPRGESV